MSINIYPLITRYHRYCKLKEIDAPDDILKSSLKLVEDTKNELKSQGFLVDEFMQSDVFKKQLFTFQIMECERDAISERCNSCNHYKTVYEPQRDFYCQYFEDDCYPATCDHFDFCGLDSNDRQVTTFERCYTCLNNITLDENPINCSLKLNDLAVQCNLFITNL